MTVCVSLGWTFSNQAQSVSQISKTKAGEKHLPGWRCGVALTIIRNSNSKLSLIHTLIKAFGTDHHIWVNLLVKLLFPPSFKCLKSIHLKLDFSKILLKWNVNPMWFWYFRRSIKKYKRWWWVACWNWSMEIGLSCREIFWRVLQSFNRFGGICPTVEATNSINAQACPFVW